MIYHGFKDLLAYQKAYQQACNIFDITLRFPKEERYSLIDQIRRSSRSVCANLAEAFRKRNYPKHYFLKLTDCQGENSETLVWLDFSLSWQYCNEDEYKQLIELNNEVGKLLSYMMNNPDKFGVSPT
jgi:four helix bundle protein